MADAEDTLAHASLDPLAHASKLLLQRGNELFTVVPVTLAASPPIVNTPEADNETKVAPVVEEQDDLTDDFFELV